MKSKYLICLSIFASTLAVSATFGADTSANWRGFYLDGAIGGRNVTSDAVNTWSSTLTYKPIGWSQTTSGEEQVDLAETSFLGQISGGWRFTSGPVLVGLGLFFDLAASAGGNYQVAEKFSSNFEGPPFFDVRRTSIEQHHRYGISLDIAPNWRTHPYLKLTYAWSEFEFGISSDCPYGSSPAGESASETLSGLGVGGGVRHLQDENLYFFAEFMWQDYGSMNRPFPYLCGQRTMPPYYSFTTSAGASFEPTNLVGVVGVGWKF